MSSLGPLAQLRRLELIDGRASRATDLSPIAALPELKVIDLTGTKIDDLRPIASLRSLRGIYLNGTRVRDVRPLAGLTELRVVCLAGTRVKIEDVECLRPLPNLRRVNLRSTPAERAGVQLDPKWSTSALWPHGTETREVRVARNIVYTRFLKVGRSRMLSEGEF